MHHHILHHLHAPPRPPSPPCTTTSSITPPCTTTSSTTSMSCRLMTSNTPCRRTGSGSGSKHVHFLWFSSQATVTSTCCPEMEPGSLRPLCSCTSESQSWDDPPGGETKRSSMTILFLFDVNTYYAKSSRGFVAATRYEI